MTLNPQQLTQFLKQFSELFLTLWVKVNQSGRITRLDNSSPKIYTKELDRKPKKQAKAEKAMNFQLDCFKIILINGIKIPVFISPDGYVVVKLKHEINEEQPETNETIFLAFKVINKEHQHLLEITGLTHKYNKQTQQYEYREGCKAKYLVNFLKFNGIQSIGNFRRSTFITDDMKAEKFQKEFVNNEIIKTKKILKREKAFNGQNAYFKFYLKLENQLKNENDIKINLNFYYNAITGYDPSQKQVEIEPIFFNDALPPDSPYYIERHLIDERCKQRIKESGAFIRIKGSRKVGKTSLLYQIIEEGEKEKYSTIFIDFSEPESEVINNFRNLCLWLCHNITEQLEQENNINDYFTQDISVFRATTRYFTKEILTLDKSILLAIDNVDKVFENPDIATQFCNMLATWHRKSAVPNNLGKKWATLHIVLAHATDVYLDWDINRSPLRGIGYVPDLLDWNVSEIQQYAEIYEVNLTQEEAEQLRNLIGGHPYLVRLAVEYLYDSQDSNMESLLRISSTLASPFNSYLRGEILPYLRKYPQLLKAFCQIIDTNQIQIDDQFILDEIIFKLNALGLIKEDENQFYPKYNLFYEFFRRYCLENE